MTLCGDIQAGRFTANALYEGDKPKDFSFLPIGQYGSLYERRTFPSFGTMLDAFYGDRERAERVRQKGQELLRTLTNARDRTARKIRPRPRSWRPPRTGSGIGRWGISSPPTSTRCIRG